jgi:gamma-glutamylcyclotransferase (GGCT)/AIG2-like uncharacterized protein YtfP
MTLHFAYGSNMSRALMRARCPGAAAFGTGVLEGFEFIIGVAGYASLERRPGTRIHGVLWRLGARDLAALNDYEGDAYLRRVMGVRHAGGRSPALLYVMAWPGRGTPRPGYIQLVVEAARDWNLPQPYIDALRRWSRSSFAGAWAKGTGEIG